jgi:hypothetical protein
MDTRTLAHFIWIGEDSMPPFYQDCLNSFYRKHPYWTVKLWLQKDVDKVIERSPYRDLFFKYDSFINKYNFVKYHILAEEGGWFVDLDIRWKRSINEIYTDFMRTSNLPQMFVPVRSFPFFPPQETTNDDMLIYADKGLLWDLIEYISKRTDIDESRKYEPFGPVSLSQWLHKSNVTREYLYENQIQVNGYYCNHLNGQSWKFY